MSFDWPRVDSGRPTRRQEVEGISLLLSLVVGDDNGVSGVVSTRASSANVSISSEDIDKFAFALVTPLGAEAGIVRTGLAQYTSRAGVKGMRGKGIPTRQ
jgi:hypothetical protein